MKTVGNILHLTLKKKWFDMILSGEKTEEYREIKPYWIKRLLEYRGVYSYPIMSPIIKSCLSEKSFEWLAYIGMYPKFYKGDEIVFTNGYGKDKPTIKVWIKGFSIKEGKQEWGAEPNKKYFTFHLGGIVSKSNCG